MKMIIVFSLFILTTNIHLAQQASDYFPDKPGLQWEYKITPLDSANNEIDTLSYFRYDLFMKEVNFEGKFANLLQTKSGPIETIEFQPYLDSIFYHFSGSDGYEYFKVGLIEHLFVFLDLLITDTTFSIVSFFNSLEQWYSVYRFAQTINDEYTILEIDTAIIVDTLNLPVRLEVIGKRLPDEFISTPIGDFTCKKFSRKIGISYLIILPPPLPPIAIPILFLEDFVWIAEDNWIVQGLIPSINVDLSVLGIESFYIPGLSTKLDGVTAVKYKITTPNEISLNQNYPNPFNPTTKIKFKLHERSKVSIKVFNLLGSELKELVNGEFEEGEYEVEFNATELTSGVYFYQLKTEGFVETKKMILMK